MSGSLSTRNVAVIAITILVLLFSAANVLQDRNSNGGGIAEEERAKFKQQLEAMKQTMSNERAKKNQEQKPCTPSNSKDESSSSAVNAELKQLKESLEAKDHELTTLKAAGRRDADEVRTLEGEVAKKAKEVQMMQDKLKNLENAVAGASTSATASSPIKRSSSPTESEMKEAIRIVLEMLKKEDVLRPGEIIAVVGSHVEPLISAIINTFPVGKNITIMAGEASGVDSMRHLQQNFPPPQTTVFRVKEEHPVPSIRKHLGDDAIDIFIVWDLDNGLNAALSYKSLTYEAHRVLRIHAGVSSRAAIFVAGQKHLPTKLLFGSAAELKEKEVAFPQQHQFSVHLLERAGGEEKDSRWSGLGGGRKLADPFLFMDRCRSPDAHMHELDVLLRFTADALEECGITYWLDSGTLLGAYRFNAYNPMEDDHDLVVDYDEFLENTFKFKKIILKRFAQINRTAFFDSVRGRAEDYKELIAQLYMLKNGSDSRPQVDMLLAKWDANASKYDLTARYFQQQTQEGFKKSIVFSDKLVTKWKTKHGYLRSIPILGREYPAPYDVEEYTAVWYGRSDFMNHIMMRQMKNNLEGFAEYCRDTYSMVFAPKNPTAVMKMVARNKELFPVTFDSESCALCNCTPTRCYVPKLVVDD